MSWVLFLEVFISILQVGTLGDTSGESFISFPDVLFYGHAPHSLIGQCQGKVVFSYCIWSWQSSPGFAAFLGLELKHN